LFAIVVSDILSWKNKTGGWVKAKGGGVSTSDGGLVIDECSAEIISLEQRQQLCFLP